MLVAIVAIAAIACGVAETVFTLKTYAKVFNQKQ